MTLPVNIDESYANRTPGDALHQAHHDVIHAAVNDFGIQDTSLRVLGLGIGNPILWDTFVGNGLTVEELGGRTAESGQTWVTVPEPVPTDLWYTAGRWKTLYVNPSRGAYTAGGINQGAALSYVEEDGLVFADYDSFAFSFGGNFDTVGVCWMIDGNNMLAIRIDNAYREAQVLTIIGGTKTKVAQSQVSLDANHYGHYDVWGSIIMNTTEMRLGLSCRGQVGNHDLEDFTLLRADVDTTWYDGVLATNKIGILGGESCSMSHVAVGRVDSRNGAF